MCSVETEAYILVVGSRTITDYSYIKAYLNSLIRQRFANSNIVIVSGGARGVDTLAERYADENCYKKVIIPANWDEYGKSAGYKRNTKMHEFIADKNTRIVVAFWDGESKGTAHNFELAKKYQNELMIVEMSKDRELEGIV